LRNVNILLSLLMFY